jgi:hypothetical protein
MRVAMRRESWWILLALAAAAPVPAMGQVMLSAAPTPPSAYPVAVQLQLSRETLLRRLQHIAGDGASAPSQPSASVRVGEQAKAAYGPVLARLFRSAAGGDRDADLAVSVGNAEVELRSDGWYARVEHVVELRLPTGVEIARWSVRGEEIIEGFGPSAIPRAFEGAARRAARGFDVGFEANDAAAAWLRGRGIALLDRRPVPPPPPAPLPVPPAPPRGGSLVFADLGGAIFPMVQSIEGFPVRLRREPASFAARAGLSGAHMLLQVTAASWHISVDNMTPTPASLASLGVDLAGVLRLGNRLEFAGGPGFHRLFAHGPGFSEAAAAPSLLAAARYVRGSTFAGLGVGLGAEVHKYFGPTLRGLGGRMNLGPAGLAFGAYLGLELPLGVRLLP